MLNLIEQILKFLHFFRDSISLLRGYVWVLTQGFCVSLSRGFPILASDSQLFFFTVHAMSPGQYFDYRTLFNIVRRLQITHEVLDGFMACHLYHGKPILP